MLDETQTSASKPAVALGLTFLLIGLTFALPYKLIPESVLTKSFQNMSPEVANVYAIVAWAGWSHFLFAFRGQSASLMKRRETTGVRHLVLYAVCIAGTVALLVGIRWVVGPILFGVVVWVYFIDHFIKAEKSFEGQKTPHAPILVRWLSSYQQLLSFAWLSAVLLGYRDIQTNYWALWCGSLLLAAFVLAFGGWRNLADGRARGTLISLFFVAEALVWGTFGQYGGPTFMNGVYVFHIAAGSYFHYLGSYFFAQSRSQERDIFLRPLSILAVNAAVIALGVTVVHQGALSWLVPVLGIQWFTLWVAVHLVTSDLFPWFKAQPSN